MIKNGGESQFLDLWDKKFVLRSVPLQAPISLNSYNLPGNHNKKAANDPVMTALKLTKFVDTGKRRRDLVEKSLK